MFQKCQALDLRNNKVKDLSTFAALVNSLNDLQVIGVAGNPCARSGQRYRLDLLGMIEKISEVGDLFVHHVQYPCFFVHFVIHSEWSDL